LFETANAADYGLSSGVITNDMQKALDLAFGLDAGMVHLNDCTVRMNRMRRSATSRTAATAGKAAAFRRRK
jgi:acyl-CoA reductase-like NAD-dependent aldehyde dehydrogenase